MAYEVVLGRSEADRQRLGTQAAVFIGKHYVKMGAVTSLSSPIFLDVNTSHVVFVCGKRGCLTVGTKVFTNHGYKPIEDYDPNNDFVWSFDVNKQRFEWLDAFLVKYPVSRAEKLIRVAFNDGQVLTMTYEHPLLVDEEKRYVWRQAKDLRVGDDVMSVCSLPPVSHLPVVHSEATGGAEIALCVLDTIASVGNHDLRRNPVIAIELIGGITEVYDLNVPKTHSFVAEGIISHNTGKSYSMGAIAEGIVDLPKEFGKNLSVILLDTMGVYWTMKYPNHKDDALLKEWGLEAKGLDVKIFTPVGYFKQQKEKGIPVDFPFAIKPSELSPEDWCLTFDIPATDPIAVFIERLILTMRSELGDYSIEDIVAAIRADVKEDPHIKQAAENRFLATEQWGIFSKEGTPLAALAQAGQATVLDMSAYAIMPNGWKIKCLVIGLISQKLFVQRMIARKEEEYQAVQSSIHYLEEEKEVEQMPLVWIVVDEAHEFLPFQGKTAASDALIALLREGRQPGVSLILATQQPGKIHTDVMTQSDILLAHRLTAKIDVDALGALLQSYMREGLDKALNILPHVAGAALALDDVNERMYPMRMRPRLTWHGGSAPTVIKPTKKIYEF